MFALEKGCRNLAVFGDSMNVINWTNGIQLCRNLRLSNMLTMVREIIQGLNSFSCRHVYRENNVRADQASKARLELVVGVWKIKEFRDGHEHDIYHRPFIDT